MFKKFTLGDMLTTIGCVAIAFFITGAIYGDRSSACMIGLAGSGVLAVWYVVKAIISERWPKR